MPEESSNTSVTINDVSCLEAGELKKRNPEASLEVLDQLGFGASSRTAKK